MRRSIRGREKKPLSLSEDSLTEDRDASSTRARCRATSLLRRECKKEVSEGEIAMSGGAVGSDSERDDRVGREEESMSDARARSARAFL